MVAKSSGTESSLMSGLLGVATLALSMAAIYWGVHACGMGKPKARDTPEQAWEKGRKQREREEAKANKRGDKASKYAAPAKVLPVETAAAADSTSAVVGDSSTIVQPFNSEQAAMDERGPGVLEQGGGAGVGVRGETAGAAGAEVGVMAAPDEQATGLEDGTVAPAAAERPPDPLPCQSCLNSHDKAFVGSWVAEVVLGNPVGEVLRGFMDQEATIAKISKARTVVRQMKTLGKAKKLVKAEAKLAKLKEKEEAVMAATRKRQDPGALEVVSVAFVTFEHEESKRRCLEDYRYSRRGFCRYFQPEALQFHREPKSNLSDSAVFGAGNEAGGTADGNASALEGESGAPPRADGTGKGKETAKGSGKKKGSKVQTHWRLKVFQAPEPSDVKWENLDVSPTSRKLRRAVTSLVCVVLLIVSFGIIYLAQSQQAILNESTPALDTCEETIPAVFFGTYDINTQAALQARRPSKWYGGDTHSSASKMHSSDTRAKESSPFARNPNVGPLDYTALPDIYDASGVSVSRDVFEATEGVELCDDPCQPASGGSTCTALSCYETSWRYQGYECETYTQSTLVGCFCLDAVVTAFEELGFVEGGKEVATEQGEMCTPFLKDYAKANAVKMLAVLSVVIVNTLLTGVMSKLAKFERHVSLSDYTSTVTGKLAIAQFLNTAMIVILVNAGYTGGGLGFLQDIGVLAGDYNDFDRSWYATVGVAVAMTMLINVVVPHVQPILGDEAQAFSDALQGEGVSGLIANHVLRKHVFPLFVFTVLFLGLYVAYNIVGDPLLMLLKLVLHTIFRVLCWWKRNNVSKAAEGHQPRPGYTAEYFRVLKPGEKIEADEKKMGWAESEDGKTAKWLFKDDAPGPRGVRAKHGVPRQTWQAIAELGQYNYVMEESDQCGMATRYMATAGFLSPRMIEKNNARKEKAEKGVTKKGAVGDTPSAVAASATDVTAASPPTPVLTPVVTAEHGSVEVVSGGDAVPGAPDKGDKQGESPAETLAGEEKVETSTGESKVENPAVEGKVETTSSEAKRETPTS
eukprot:jgi/Undpi1/4647/HiC_scaffold_18.g08001.m1